MHPTPAKLGLRATSQSPAKICLLVDFWLTFVVFFSPLDDTPACSSWERRPSWYSEISPWQRSWYRHQKCQRGKLRLRLCFIFCFVVFLSFVCLFFGLLNFVLFCVCFCYLSKKRLSWLEYQMMCLWHGLEAHKSLLVGAKNTNPVKAFKYLPIWWKFW